ncbi:recombinase family protein [Promicromonospora sp. CA-289599]|uniref:recombinase family protein n=1 Tax=Promicromonospora sp. CA-289599 TaxID=3240014 RepID=UPI003D8F1999
MDTPAGAPRAVIYIRLSVHRGTADPTVSPESQEDACRAYARSQGWDVVAVVRDLDVSASVKGKRLDRPGLREVREHVTRHGATRVLSLKIDRLARSTKDFLTIAEDLEALGATLATVKEGLDLATPMGRFVAQVLASFAELEAAVIADRVRDARAVLDAKGRFAGGRVPYGYQIAEDPNSAGVILTPKPDEAAFWTKLAEFIRDGGSLHAATAQANASLFRPRVGKTFNTSTIRSTLTGDAIVGIRDGRQVYEPALDADLWHAVREIFASRRTGPRDGRRPRSTTWRLSLVMECAGCSSPLWVKRDQGYLYARCSVKTNGGDCPAPANINYERLEAHVLAELEPWATRVQLLRVETHGTNPAALRAAEGVVEAAEARQRAARTREDALAAYEDVDAARSALAALQADAGQVRNVPTGRTLWEALTDPDDVHGAAEALATVLDAIVVTKAAVRGFDPANVAIVRRGSTHETEHAAAKAR